MTKESYILLQNFHSDRKLLAGLTIAARIAWKLTVITAMSMDNNPAIKNIHQSMVV